ncbi:MAG TPA: hypothetical protein VMS17_30990 [Gemmataceae bacterium]|nr:hypothetical protein [Gemmataceae bacterium]
MNVTFSPTADAILGQQQTFRQNLTAALAGLPGSCFIDGKVGRSPADDSVVLLCQGREPITVQHYDFRDASTVKRIVQQWSSSAVE